MLTQAILDRSYFDDLKRKILDYRKPKEHFFTTLSAECSQFIRLNAAKVRQIGTVEDAVLELALVLESEPGVLRKATRSVTLRGLSYEDWHEIQGALQVLRHEVAELPPDPYAELPKNLGSSAVEKPGNPPRIQDAPDALIEAAAGADLAGIYASGTSVRAMANSAGLTHWFSSANFTFDYSLYTPSQRAWKATFAGRDWDSSKYRSEMERARRELTVLEQPARRIERGTYRTYLAPHAAADLLQMLSWGEVSESAIRQGESPLRLLRSGERKLSRRFNLSEDFRGSEVPRFNSEGELAPDWLPLIREGELANTLVAARTAREYGVPSNGASDGEAMRAPALQGGSLCESEILAAIGTGLYLSNLHYLNWSDQPGGRVTGMTRYACFWVEKGKIVCPIENMRFDDSIFTLFGPALADLTEKPEYIPAVGSYFMRDLGGTWCPGMLLEGMTLTI